MRFKLITEDVCPTIARKLTTKFPLQICTIIFVTLYFIIVLLFFVYRDIIKDSSFFYLLYPAKADVLMIATDSCEAERSNV